MFKIPSILSIGLFIAMSFSTQAQDKKVNQDVQVDIPDYYKKQADSIRQLYVSRGFELLKANFMAMESGYEIPIVLPLEAGTWYQFVFIGDNTNRYNEMRMYDYNEKMVIYQSKQWADVDGNIIDVPYIAKHTEYHMLKPVQQNKKKKWLAGGIMLFKRTGANAFKGDNYSKRN
jgi:hypothetical protein